jgi:large subunit ribosomal protein L5
MYLKEKYNKEIVSQLKDELWIKNIMEIPKVEKIVLNMGIWSYIRAWNKDFSSLEKDLALIAGQKPVIKYARKSISNFKLREGMPVWLTVVLRWDKAYTFLEKMVDIVIPRIRDFRWLSKKSFDKEGNYNFGIKEHTIFPEVPQTDVVKPHGLQITVKINAKAKEHWVTLLEKMGFPFAK